LSDVLFEKQVRFFFRSPTTLCFLDETASPQGSRSLGHRFGVSPLNFTLRQRGKIQTCCFYFGNSVLSRQLADVCFCSFFPGTDLSACPVVFLDDVSLGETMGHLI